MCVHQIKKSNTTYKQILAIVHSTHHLSSGTQELLSRFKRKVTRRPIHFSCRFLQQPSKISFSLDSYGQNLIQIKICMHQDAN